MKQTKLITTKTVVAVTDLFSLANQCLCQAIWPHTDQSEAERIDPIYPSRTFSFSPFWKSLQSGSTRLAAKKDLSPVLFDGHSTWKIFTEDNAATSDTHTHTKNPALRPVTRATCYSDTPTNSRTNILPATPNRTFSHSDSSLLLL